MALSDATGEWCLVYRFMYWDCAQRAFVVAENDYATERAITEVGGKILRESQLSVHPSKVGRAGYLLRP